MKKILTALLAMSVNIYCQINLLGDNKTNFIVGGENAKIRDFPFMVLLEITINKHRGGSCGGVYIHKVWILTAAHCLVVNNDFPPDVGSQDRIKTIMGLEEVNQKDYQTSSSVAIIAHPKFFRNRTYIINDIGLVRINRGFKITTTVKIGRVFTKPIQAGAKVIAIGWGATLPTDIPGFTTSPKKLQKIHLTVWNTSDCFNISNTETGICVGEKGKTPCYGDSGGPLIYENQAIGVTSYGFGCSGPVTVYEAIYYHQSWIEEIRKTHKLSKSTALNMNVGHTIYFSIAISMIIQMYICC